MTWKDLMTDENEEIKRAIEYFTSSNSVEYTQSQAFSAYTRPLIFLDSVTSDCYLYPDGNLPDDFEIEDEEVFRQLIGIGGLGDEKTEMD